MTLEFLVSSCSGFDLELKQHNYFFLGCIQSGAVKLQDKHWKGLLQPPPPSFLFLWHSIPTLVVQLESYFQKKRSRSVACLGTGSPEMKAKPLELGSSYGAFESVREGTRLS